MNIKKIHDGGIIPVYRCPASCRHCLYGCSNKMNGTYMTKEQGDKLASELHDMGCRSVHIGGGEPFLSFAGLANLIENLNRNNIDIDYIETNASWCADSFDDEKILSMLRQLMKLGARCLLISIDPFHVEFVPLKKPIRLVELCKRAGMDYFIWKQSYLNTLSSLDVDSTYSRAELEQILGSDYIIKTAQQYGLSYNGRALNIAREYIPKHSYETYLDEGACRELYNTYHYHADYNGYFIPPSCTGIGVLLSDMQDITDKDYPVYTRLADMGVGELYEYASGYGFKPLEDGYVSKCDFCYDMRKFLSIKKSSKDIYPPDYYTSDF